MGIKAWAQVAIGIGIMSFIPLILGCLGKYGVISMDRAVFKGMIVSGSIGTAIVSIALVGTLLARVTPLCNPCKRQLDDMFENANTQIEQVARGGGRGIAVDDDIRENMDRLDDLLA